MTVASAYYATSLDHVLAELERIDLLVRIQVWRARQVQTSDDGFQGLYISEQDVDNLLNGPRGMPHWAAAPSPVPDSEVQDALKRLRRESSARKAGSIERGLGLRLQVLESHFGLSSRETDALLVCLAPEVDLRYERLYAYLQDDVTKTRPSADLVLNVICQSFAAKLEARSCFLHQAPLFSNNLVQFFDGPAQREPTILGQFLKVNPRRMGLNLLVVSVEHLVDGSPADLESKLRLAAREAVFQNAALLFTGLDALAGNEGKALFQSKPPMASKSSCWPVPSASHEAQPWTWRRRPADWQCGASPPLRRLPQTTSTRPAAGTPISSLRPWHRRCFPTTPGMTLCCPVTASGNYRRFATASASGAWSTISGGSRESKLRAAR